MVQPVEFQFEPQVLVGCIPYSGAHGQKSAPCLEKARHTQLNWSQTADNRLAFVACFPYNPTDFRTIDKRLRCLLVEDNDPPLQPEFRLPQRWFADCPTHVFPCL